MSEGNTPAEALVGSSDFAAMQKMIAELQAKLALYEDTNVVRPKFDGEVPKYRLNVPFFGPDDTKYPEGSEIEYLGTPNMEMVPLNNAARARIEDYIDELTEGARQKAALVGRNFNGLPGDVAGLIAMALSDARTMKDEGKVQPVLRLPEPTDSRDVPSMPHTEQAEIARRKAGRPKKGSELLSAVTPPPPMKPIPIPNRVLGTGTRG